MPADVPLEASDCPNDEMTEGPIIEIGNASVGNDFTGFLFDDEERANRAKALRPKPKEGLSPSDG